MCYFYNKAEFDMWKTNMYYLILLKKSAQLTVHR